MQFPKSVQDWLTKCQLNYYDSLSIDNNESYIEVVLQQRLPVSKPVRLSGPANRGRALFAPQHRNSHFNLFPPHEVWIINFLLLSTLIGSQMSTIKPSQGYQNGRFDLKFFDAINYAKIQSSQMLYTIIENKCSVTILICSIRKDNSMIRNFFLCNRLLEADKTEKPIHHVCTSALLCPFYRILKV